MPFLVRTSSPFQFQYLCSIFRLTQQYRLLHFLLHISALCSTLQTPVASAALNPNLSETPCQDSTSLFYSQNIVPRLESQGLPQNFSSLKDQEVWCFLMASAQNTASYILSSIIVDYSRRATLSQLKLDITILFKFLIKKYKWIHSFVMG